MTYAENKTRAVALLKAAVEATILIKPRNYGLTRDELLAVAALVGIKEGLANDALAEVARDLRLGERGHLRLDPDDYGLPGHINADFNFLLEPEVRNVEAFEFVRRALQERAEEVGERAATMTRDELVALGESRGLNTDDVEVAITGTVLSQIFVENDGDVRHAPGRIGWILPSAQRKQMERHEIELHRSRDVGIVLPHVRAVLERRTTASVAAHVGLQRESRSEQPVVRIFISHSSTDATIAKKVIDFIEAGLEVPDGAIRCTSVPGYKLEPGDNAPETLRKNLADCGAVLALITKSSMSSSFVLLELGAAWMAHKRAIPLVGPKASFTDLPAFFKEIHAIELHNVADMAGLIATLAKATGLRQRDNQPKRTAALAELAKLADGATKEPPPAPSHETTDEFAQVAEPTRDILRTLRSIAKYDGLLCAGDDFGGMPVRGKLNELNIDIVGRCVSIDIDFGGRGQRFDVPFSRLGMPNRMKEIWHIYGGSQAAANR